MKLQNYPEIFRVFKTSCYWIDAGYNCIAQYCDGVWVPSELWPGSYAYVTELELLLMTGTSRSKVINDIIPIIETIDNVHTIKHMAMMIEAARTGVQEDLISPFSCGSCPPAATRII